VNCGLRIAECGLEEDESLTAFNLSFNPQSEIRIPQSEELTEGARLSDATTLQNHSSL
jgi:hypothetical protein